MTELTEGQYKDAWQKLHDEKVAREQADFEAANNKKSAATARDDFLQYLILHYTPEQCGEIFYTADKLLDMVTKPMMLNAFTLVNAELAALHEEGNLESRIVVPE